MGILQSIHALTKTVIARVDCTAAYLVHPFEFVRTIDHEFSGQCRDWVPEHWNKAMNTMNTLELATRKSLMSIIDKRMIRMEAARKYTHCKRIDVLLEEYPEWEKQKFFKLYDLFKVFEMDGDGVIEIPEMSVGMDNLGDTTGLRERIRVLCSYDDDNTGFIDFEEFLNIIYDLQVTQRGKHTIAQHYQNVEDDVTFINAMSPVQRITLGLL